MTVITQCPRPIDPRFIDLTGKVFFKLTVLRFYGKDERGNRYWECGCDCGVMSIKPAMSITSGRTKSCGCYRREHTLAKNRRYQLQHQPEWAPEWRTYRGAYSRCNNPKIHNYARYGGRGIEFRFKNFEEFAHHLGHKPSDSHSLDRIDNDGHYEVGNVRWVTAHEQNLNRKSNRHINALGLHHTLSEWAQIQNLRIGTISFRIKKGWCGECAITLRPKQGICPHKN